MTIRTPNARYGTFHQASRLGFAISEQAFANEDANAVMTTNEAFDLVKSSPVMKRPELGSFAPWFLLSTTDMALQHSVSERKRVSTRMRRRFRHRPPSSIAQLTTTRTPNALCERSTKHLPTT